MWARQVRWARLRRATFALCFAPELLTTSLVALIAAAVGADALGLPPPLAVSIAALLWYGAEAGLAYVAGWPLTLSSPFAWIVRDLLLPWLWLEGWNNERFVWRGNVMSADEPTLATEGTGTGAGG